MLFRFQEPPVLHLPNNKDKFHLYSDTSEFATEGALYQVQDGTLKFIVYVSKRIPEEGKNILLQN